MKGENEFGYFLIAGLAILAILLAVFSFSGTNTACCPGTNQTPGYVQAVKTFTIPSFAASNVLDTRTSQLVNRNVFSGLLFGEDRIVYNLTKSGLQDVTLSFTINDLNRLGNLVIKVNGNVIENRIFEPGSYDVQIPVTGDSMIIEIAAESSYWKIWAPNIYSVRDASLTYTSYSEEISQFRFYLGEEYLNHRFSKVDLVLSQNVGTLIVDMNGRTIWNSPVASLQTIQIDRADLRLGDNIIGFSAAQNSQFTGSASIVAVFLSQFPQTINQTGLVTATQPFLGTYP